MSQQQLRIGLIYDDTLDRPGGVSSYVLTMGAHLTQRGHHVEYLVGGRRPEELDAARTHSLARNVSVRFNGNSLSIPVWSSGRELGRVLEKGAFDVLHVQAPYSPLMAGRLIRRAGPSCAVISTYHVASERMLPKLGARALASVCRRSDARIDVTISVSRTSARFAKRWSGVESESVIPNPVDSSRATANNAIEIPAAEIVVIARLVRRKGIAQLLNGLAALRQNHGMTPRVAIVGDGPLRLALERRVRRLGFEQSVRFEGSVTDEAKFAMLRQAKIACFPSLYGESFGVVIPEALMSGAQVVLAGHNDGYRELLHESALVDPRNAVVLADRIAQLLNDGALRRRLGSTQRKAVAECDARSVCDAILELYERAMHVRRLQDMQVRRGGGGLVTTHARD